MKETRFKNTELGPIPVDWEVTPLYEAFSFGNGYTPSKEVKNYWEGGKLPWFRIEDIKENGHILIDSIQHVTEEAIKGTLFPANSFIISTSATIGEYALIKCHSIANQRFVYLIPKTTSRIIEGYFLHHCALLGQWCRENADAGSSFASVNLARFKDYLILHPSSPVEQERIAEALSDVDALIAELGELIEKKRLVKQGAMQQLLTPSRRLPDFSKPWKEYKLGEIGVFSKGKGISKAETTSEGLPCIRYGEIYTSHHDYIKSFVSYISQQTAMDSVALRKGQILFTASGETKEEIGKAVAFNLDLEAYAGGDIIIFTPTIQCDPIFLGYVMNTPGVNSQKSALGQGDAVVHIGAAALSTILVYIPDLAEQRAIAEILTDMDNEIAELEAKREKYRAIKEGIMQLLLTGRIRLIDPSTSSGTIDPSASFSSDGDTPAAHTPPITYEPSTSYPHSLAAEP